MLTLRLLPFLGVLCGACLVATPLASAKSSPAFADLSFDAALQRAAAEQKIVFVDFYTTWCGPCKMLDETTWQDAAVIALLQAKAVALKIDAEKERDLAARYKVDAYPTLLLLKPDGTELDRIVGYRPADKFIEEFNAGLTGKGSAARAEEAVSRAATERDQVQARYQLGKTLVQQGKHAEALAEFLWCYDEGMVQARGFAGVRNSYLLRDLSNLGKRYEPARAALVERRDRAQAKFLEDKGDRNTARDLGALNKALGEDAKTLALFDQLSSDDKRRPALGTNLLPQLLEARRYVDALSVQRYDAMVMLIQPMTAESTGMDKLPPEAKQVVHRGRVKWFAERIEILAGAGDLDHAREFLAKARTFDSSAEATAVYQQHLARAGHPELLPAGPANGG